MREHEVIYPSEYFCAEVQRTQGGAEIEDSYAAANNIYLNGVRVAVMVPDGSAWYYLTDQVDSVKLVTDDNANAVSRMEYMPYGETWFQEGEDNHAPKYNSQELDRETGYYFYNARHYDPEIGRFVTADSVIDGEKYDENGSVINSDTQGWNRYSYVKGNPITYKDPTGHDTYTVIWQSKEGETGHAGIAIENYKKINGKDVKDGTLTYYDLWPKKPVGKTELQSGVKPDYNKRTILKLDDLLKKDPSISAEKGHVSEFGEGRSPDNVVKLKTTYKQDMLMKQKAESLLKANSDYNASANNCSSFVQNVLKSVFKKFDASQKIVANSMMKMLGYKDADVVAPNNLHNEAASQKEATTIKGSKNVPAKPYLEYFK